METDLVAIVEGLNESLKERFMGVTMRLWDDLESQLQEALPPPVAHWKADHGLTFRCVEYAVPRNDVKTFIARHTASSRRPGWKELIHLADL
jgi:hypothetical protein